MLVFTDGPFALCSALPFPLSMTQGGPSYCKKEGLRAESCELSRHGALMGTISFHLGGDSNFIFLFEASLFTKHTSLKGPIGWCCIFYCIKSQNGLVKSYCEGSLVLSQRRK